MEGPISRRLGLASQGCFWHQRLALLSASLGSTTREMGYQAGSPLLECLWCLPSAAVQHGLESGHAHWEGEKASLSQS